MIYFIEEEGGEYIKVGYSRFGCDKKNRKVSRLMQLQTGNPRKLVLLGQFNSTLKQEQSVHAVLSMVMRPVSGEWYNREICISLMDCVNKHNGDIKLGLELFASRYSVLNKKRCSRCGEIKHTSEFSSDPSTLTRSSCYCKSCRKDRYNEQSDLPMRNRWHNIRSRSAIEDVPNEFIDFQEFKAWANESGGQLGLYIFRVDQSLGFTKDNCIWVTRGEATRMGNQRNSAYSKEDIKLAWKLSLEDKLSHSKIAMRLRGSQSSISRILRFDSRVEDSEHALISMTAY